MAIRKQLGFSGWQIVYAVDIDTLLPVLAWPLVGCIALMLVVCIGLRWLIMRIERRLITPGEHRIQALVESFANHALKQAMILGRVRQDFVG